MPRLVNRLPKYFLHKPSGHAKTRCGGKDTYLSRYGSPESKEAYARFIASIPKPGDCTRPRQPSPGIPSMVGEVVEHCEQHALWYYSREGIPTGERTTIHYALVPLVKRFDDLSVTEFGPKELERDFQEMTKRLKKPDATPRPAKGEN